MPAVAESDIGGQTRLAQGEGDVVSAPEMFLDQGREREIGQDVAAVGEKRLVPEMRLRVFDSRRRFRAGPARATSLTGSSR